MSDMLTIFKHYPHIPKVWGEEIVLTNNKYYCCKLLSIAAGMQCSFHRHPCLKNESFFVVQGQVDIELGDRPGFPMLKEPGDGVFVPVGTWHRFGAPYGPAIILEVSTHHEDEDVERRYPSGPIAAKPALPMQGELPF